MTHTPIKFDFSTTDTSSELWFRCEMNKRQFQSLSKKLSDADIENEIINNTYYLEKVNQALNFSNIELSQWLKNAWNTESVLSQNKAIIKNTGQSFCMQWAFPQAYYAVFGNILAMFKAIGYTETSHTAVLRKYSSLMIENKLPESVSICCDGIEKEFTYHHIQQPVDIGHMDLDLENPDCIDNQICQFLKATRRLRLKEKAPKMGFKNAQGEPRRKLNKTHWTRVSKKIGPTSIIDFLYRKRIKGNYEDIETYSSQHFDGKTVLNSLVDIVCRINLVNETYIAKAIGIDMFEELADFHLSRVENDNLGSRIVTIKEIINASG